jgi:hypothetical protein
MLVVTVDLVPGGYEAHRRTIGSMRIANVSNLSDVSDYVVEATESANPTNRRAAAQRGLHGTSPRPHAERLDASGESIGGNHQGGFRQVVENARTVVS